MPAPRVLALGLDGVPVGLIRALTDDGTMPFLKTLLPEGELRAMRSSLPAVSSTAWATVMTGCNPGRHGVFGFFSVAPGGGLEFPNYTTLGVPAVWDRLGEAGLRSAVINVPHTYPARPHPGVLVSGFVALELAKSVHPPEWLAPLRQLDYMLDVDYQRAREEPAPFFRDLHLALERRLAAMTRVLDSEPWPFAMLVFTETDRLLHFYLGDYLTGGAQRGEFVRFFAALDRALATLVNNYGGGKLLLLADHGFGPLHTELFLNHWLRQRGDLEWTRFPPRGWGDLAPSSRAFCLEPGRIYLNTPARGLGGSVTPAAAAALSTELAAGLRALAVDGAPAVARVFTAAELYSGPLAGRGPDLVAVGNPGWEMKGTIAAATLIGASRFSGQHTWNDALLWVRGGGLRDGELTVADIAPTVLSWLGRPVPAELDGRPLLAAG